MIKNEINWNVLYIQRCQFLKILDYGEKHQHMKTENIFRKSVHLLKI